MLPSPLHPGTGTLLLSESDGTAEPGGLEQGQEQSYELPIGKRGQDLKGGLYKREFKVIDIP